MAGSSIAVSFGVAGNIRNDLQNASKIRIIGTWKFKINDRDVLLVCCWIL
jgi:hypothetical protein